MKNLLEFLVFCILLIFVDLKIANRRYTVVDVTRFKRDIDKGYIYACGNEFMETSCKCNDTVLNCDFYDVKNLNIHIIAENFTVRTAQFRSNGIAVLKKKQILPGREYSILYLDFSHNWISTIENGAFDEFKNLQQLILNNNSLTSIDENVLTESLGKTLVHLDLKENKLEQITLTAFKYMLRLESLNLSNNAVLRPFFNRELFSPSLQNLRELDLSWCNISTLDDDTFVNLLNLKSIDFHLNRLTTVPKAINFIPNLESLCLSHTDIKTLNKKDFGFNPKLKYLGFYGMRNLTTVNDCAFCNFPNLQRIIFWGSPKLSYFHENAFGSISSGKLYPNIKEFNIELTNVLTVSEKLFDWNKADELYLGTFGYNCNCSVAWLTNVLRSPDSFFKSKMRRSISRSFFKCKNESTVIDESVCGGGTRKSSNGIIVFDIVYWMLLIGLFLSIAVICYINRKRIISFVHPSSSSSEDRDKLFHYRNLEEDAIYHDIVEDSVSM